jgi:hypothetical protein
LLSSEREFLLGYLHLGYIRGFTPLRKLRIPIQCVYGWVQM